MLFRNSPHSQDQPSLGKPGYLSQVGLPSLVQLSGGSPSTDCQTEPPICNQPEPSVDNFAQVQEKKPHPNNPSPYDQSREDLTQESVQLLSSPPLSESMEPIQTLRKRWSCKKCLQMFKSEFLFWMHAEKCIESHLLERAEGGDLRKKDWLFRSLSKLSEQKPLIANSATKKPYKNHASINSFHEVISSIWNSSEVASSPAPPSFGTLESGVVGGPFYCYKCVQYFKNDFTFWLHIDACKLPKSQESLNSLKQQPKTVPAEVKQQQEELPQEKPLSLPSVRKRSIPALSSRKRRKSSRSNSNNCEIIQAEDDDESLIRCICGIKKSDPLYSLLGLRRPGRRPNRDSRYVCCDTCDFWSHCKCVGYDPDRSSRQEQFVCPFCRLREEDEISIDEESVYEEGTPLFEELVRSPSPIVFVTTHWNKESDQSSSDDDDDDDDDVIPSYQQQRIYVLPESDDTVCKKSPSSSPLIDQLFERHQPIYATETRLPPPPPPPPLVANPPISNPPIVDAPVADLQLKAQDWLLPIFPEDLCDPSIFGLEESTWWLQESAEPEVGLTGSTDPSEQSGSFSTSRETSPLPPKVEFRRGDMFFGNLDPVYEVPPAMNPEFDYKENQPHLLFRGTSLYMCCV